MKIVQAAKEFDDKNREVRFLKKSVLSNANKCLFLESWASWYKRPSRRKTEGLHKNVCAHNTRIKERVQD